MATFKETVQVVIDFVDQGAGQKISAMRANMAAADTTAGKFKAGLAGLGDLAVNTAGGLTAMATSALLFGKKSVDAFESAALAAGKMRDATGLTTQQASAWAVVADDLGVSTDSLTTALGKMNKAAAANKLPAMAEAATSTNARFLETVQYLHGISDETERSTQAAAIFGRGWQAIAPLLSESAAELADQLKGVSSAVIISDKQVAEAREFKATLTDVENVAKGVEIHLGAGIAESIDKIAAAWEAWNEHVQDTAKSHPILTELNNAGQNIYDSVVRLKSVSWGDIFEKQSAKAVAAVDEFAPKVAQLGSNLFALQAGMGQTFDASASTFAAGLDDANGAISATIRGTDGWTGAVDANLAALRKQNDALKASADAIAAESKAARDAADDHLNLADATDAANKAAADAVKIAHDHKSSVDDVAKANRDATRAAAALADAIVKQAADTATASGHTYTAADAQNAWSDSMLTQAANSTPALRGSILDYLATVDQIPPSKLTTIKADIAAGDVAAAQQVPDDLTKPRTVSIVPRVVGQGGSGFTPGFGPQSAPQSAPDAPGVSATALGATASTSSAPAASTMFAVPVMAPGNVNVTVNVPPGIAPRELVDALTALTRANGTTWAGGTA